MRYDWIMFKLKTLAIAILATTLAGCSCAASPEDTSSGSTGATTSDGVGGFGEGRGLSESEAADCRLYEDEVISQTQAGETVTIVIPVECNEFWFDTGRPSDDDGGPREDVFEDEEIELPNEVR